MKAHFGMMAACDARTGARLRGAAAGLPDAGPRAEFGAAFGSVLGTLDHVTLADVIRLARLRGIAGPRFALDHVLRDDLAELAAARRVLDAGLSRLVAALDGAAIARPFSRRTVTDGREATEPVAGALARPFSRQTHRRGQVHALLTRLTGRAPALDPTRFTREVA